MGERGDRGESDCSEIPDSVDVVRGGLEGGSVGSTRGVANLWASSLPNRRMLSHSRASIWLEAASVASLCEAILKAKGLPASSSGSDDKFCANFRGITPSGFERLFGISVPEFTSK